jgi:MFS family permease
MEKIAKILLASESVWAFGSGLFLPIFAIFSEQVGGDILDAGIAAALFLLVTSMMQLPLGIWLDKVKEKWFLVFCYFLTALVFLGYAFVHNKWELFALQIVFGVAIAVGDTAWDSMFDRSTDDRRSGRSWSMYHMLAGFATAFGIIIGASIVHFYGFPVIFIVGSVFAFIAGMVAVIFLKNSDN